MGKRSNIDMDIKEKFLEVWTEYTYFGILFISVIWSQDLKKL
jgi:hypothetical protein